MGILENLPSVLPLEVPSLQARVALDARWWLMRAYGQGATFQEILDQLAESQEAVFKTGKLLPAVDRDRWLAVMKSPTLKLNELDAIVLFLEYIYGREHKYSKNFLTQFDRHERALISIGAPNSDMVRMMAQRKQRVLYHRLLPRVRAKLAAVELAAALAPSDGAFCHLIEISPRYLASQGVVSRIGFLKRHAASGGEQKRRKASSLFESYLKALKGDGRKKKRLYEVIGRRRTVRSHAATRSYSTGVR